MPLYDIAGLKVRIDNCSGRTKKQAVAYLSENQNEDIKADIEINVSRERIERSVKEHPEMNQNDWQYMLTGSDFYKGLINYDGLLLHSSCVVVDDRAYAFSADSGVGKSTHTQLWLKKFGSRAYMLNDDKPAIRIIGSKVYACGTPWSGKYDYSKPEIVELAGICFVERGTENEIKPADTQKAIYNIFSQTVRQLGAEDMEKLIDVLNKLFEKVPIYELKCNMSPQAADVSYNAMKRDKK